ncbi:MAG: TAXI family TRAP transporter solute-binding subunit [Deltaproteobacteria bacterium]|nr:TAXI family TRAP transporter solute-binding subunit [Deltaproteobacteria bacterium]
MKKKTSLFVGAIIILLVVFYNFRAVAQTYTLDIISLPVGYGVYNMGVGLAEEINKNSKIIKAAHFEGKDPTVTMRMLITEPARKKRTIFFCDSWATWAGEKQIGLLRDVKYDYSKFKGLYLLSVSPNVLATTNPNIKTLEDLKGKRVVLTSTRGGVVDNVLGGILKEAGILDTLKLQYLKPAEAKDALKDGLIDAAMFGISLRKLPNVYKSAPTLVELTSTKDTYFISIPKIYVESFARKMNCYVRSVKVPPKMMGPLQTEPVEVISKYLFWACHSELPDEVVSEVLQIVYDRAHLFKNYDLMGEILSKETMAKMGLKEHEIDPAAVKFYKEKKIPIGELVE